MKLKHIFIILCFLLMPVIILAANKENKYKIFVDIEYNKLYLLENNVCIKTYDICSGKYSTPSPIGTFTIMHKDTWGEGFGGAWMGLNVPWGKYGIHGTISPETIGYAASHGCIRMRNKEAKELYNIVPYGTKVTIWGNSNAKFHYGLKTLKPGNTGADIYEIQNRLKNLGYYKSIPNGRFDSTLEYALKQFQKEKNLPVKPQVGSLEYNALGVILMD